MYDLKSYMRGEREREMEEGRERDGGREREREKRGRERETIHKKVLIKFHLYDEPCMIGIAVRNIMTISTTLTGETIESQCKFRV